MFHFFTGFKETRYSSRGQKLSITNKMWCLSCEAPSISAKVYRRWSLIQTLGCYTPINDRLIDWWVLWTVVEILCVVDAVSAFWQSHSSEFPSLSVLRSCISDVRRRLTLHSSTDVDETSAAGEQPDNSSSDSDDVKWMIGNKLCIVAICDNCAPQCSVRLRQVA